MQQLRFSRLRISPACLHATRLIITIIAARRNFSIHFITGQPDLKIVSLGRAEADVTAAIELYEAELGIPATDALTRPPARLVEMVLSAFPKLEKKLIAGMR